MFKDGGDDPIVEIETDIGIRHGVMAAAKRLGHSNASVTTRHYARAVEARDAQIAEGFDADQWSDENSGDSES